MAWSSLPLIDMGDVYIRKGSSESKNVGRLQNRNPVNNIEKDISKQLSAFREQSRTNKDDGGQNKSLVDEFGRGVRQKPPSNGGGQDQEDRDSFRSRERSRSPRRWRDDDGERDRNRGREWGREEPRRRVRDSYYSDGSEDGGRNGERYRDWPSRGRESDQYRDRRDYDYRDNDDREYRDRDNREYRDRDDREYRDRDDREYRDRDDRDWRRDRVDDRDNDRRREYRDKYRNDDDRHWSEHRSHDRYRDDRDHHRREYREEPSEIVMLKGLPTTIEDTQIHEILADAKLPYKDVRVVKTREGYSRGFAFVEFLDMETAKKWIEDCKGKLVIEDASVIMDFSRSKMAVESHRDWVCSKCGTQNFSSKRRNTCFTCNTPKDENDETKELGTTPCKGTVSKVKMSTISKHCYGLRETAVVTYIEPKLPSLGDILYSEQHSE